MVQTCKNDGRPDRTGECAAPDGRAAADDARRALAVLLESGLFKALGDPTRVAVLGALLDGDEATVTEIANCCPVDLSVVSRHLGILREAGVVGSEKQGREVRYRPNVSGLVDALRTLANSLERCCLPHQDALEVDEEA